MAEITYPGVTLFSVGIIVPLIIEPLRYHFQHYGKGANLVWDEDERARTIEIEEAFNNNLEAIAMKPRIIVSRGGFSCNKTGLSENLAEGESLTSNLGLRNNKNLLFYSGNANIMIEARNKGTCELITDMVVHFIDWSRPAISDSQGFKEFGLPMSVSDCNLTPNEEPSVQKYQVNIQVPWMKEELWKHSNDGMTLKKIVQKITPSY